MKGLRVTKVMWCQVSKGQVEDSGVHPCSHGRPEGEQGGANAPPWIWSFGQTLGQNTKNVCYNTNIWSKY